MFTDHTQRPYFYADGQWLDPPANTIHAIGDTIPNHSGRVIAAARHNEGVNMAFADGHSKWVKGSNIQSTRAN